jgi:archaemetzincin
MNNQRTTKAIIKMFKSQIPSKQQREAAIGLEQIEASKRKIYSPDSKLFKPLTKIKSGDWLAEHKEFGQSFRSYSQGSYNRVKGSKQNVIYLMCLDKVDDQYLIDLDVLVEYMSAFYYPLKVKMISGSGSNQSFKTRMNHGVKQYYIPDIFALLKTHIAKDAYCLIGVTMTDLYPNEDWNFVFGQASITGRYGVFSFARYHPAFYDSTVEVDQEEVKNIMLRRSCRVCSHEVGHMFGLLHCIYYNCIMMGSNHLEETDSKASDLCPVCLHKLQSNIGFNEMKRYTALSEFFNKYSDIFPEEKEWTEERIKSLQN